MTEITYTIGCLEEDIPVRGNAIASGDDAVDKETEDWIFEQLNSGNPWAWCCVKVTATVDLDGDEINGYTYLGACSYKSEADFKADGYYEDMKAQAKEDLISKLKGLVADGELAKKALKGIK